MMTDGGIDQFGVIACLYRPQSLGAADMPAIPEVIAEFLGAGPERMRISNEGRAGRERSFDLRALRECLHLRSVEVQLFLSCDRIPGSAPVSYRQYVEILIHPKRSHIFAFSDRSTPVDVTARWAESLVKLVGAEYGFVTDWHGESGDPWGFAFGVEFATIDDIVNGDLLSDADTERWGAAYLYGRDPPWSSGKIRRVFAVNFLGAPFFQSRTILNSIKSNPTLMGELGEITRECSVWRVKSHYIPFANELLSQAGLLI